ncbi:MAG: GNAT family N-acetyltransferase, partial [Clostridia bacterium]|nr:GNAT family N-acetyltransferase [Clostridia bacterium]
MICELNDTSKASRLFDGWEETLITSCLQQVMGRIFVTDTEHPGSALAFVGCFGFFAGEPDRELAGYRPEGFAILTPQNDAWAKLIEEAWPDA